MEEERVSGTEARAALRNLVLMISSLCACGFSELRPTRANTELFQLQGFVLPQPSTPGQAVRNVQAFQVYIKIIIVSIILRIFVSRNDSHMNTAAAQVSYKIMFNELINPDGVIFITIGFCYFNVVIDIKI